MGGHFGSIHFHTDDADKVWSAVSAIAVGQKLKFLLGPPIKGWIAAYPENNGQDPGISETLASRLPDVEFIQCLVHDDDVFAYWFYRNGSLVDYYNSCPTYFSDKNPQPRGGDAEMLAHLLVKPRSVEKLQQLLDRERFDFEMQRFDEFAALLGLSNAVTAYEYLQGSERDGIKYWRKFIHVPDLTVEKDAQRAAAARVRSGMKRLLRGGVLLADLQEEKMSRISYKSPFWCINPNTNGVMFGWRWFSAVPVAATPLLNLKSPNWKPLPIDIEPSAEIGELAISPSGKWLAAIGLKIRIWNLNTGKVHDLDPEPRGTRCLCFTPDERLLLISSESSVKMVTLGVKMDLKAVLPNLDAAKLAVHPAGDTLVVVDPFGILILFDLETGRKITQVWIKERFGVLPEHLRGAMIERAKESFLATVSSHLSAAALEKYKKDSERHFLPRDPIRTVTFSPDGAWLLCGTREGLHVFFWKEVLACPEMSPLSSQYFVKADNVTRQLPSHTSNHSLIYAVVFDSAPQRVLFSGLEGRIKYLELATGNHGDLLVPPDPIPMTHLGLMPDRSALVCTAVRIDLNRQWPPHLQVWSYPKLCEAAGIPY